MADLNLNHCAHNYMTLVEGNQSSQISADAFHGSSSHLVLFRNHADAQHPTPRSSHLISVDLHSFNRFISAVGNVFGQPGMMRIKYSPTSSMTSIRRWQRRRSNALEISVRQVKEVKKVSPDTVFSANRGRRTCWRTWWIG